MAFGSGDLGMGVVFSLVDNATGPARAAGASVANLENQVNKSVAAIQGAASKITSGIIAVTTAAALLVAPFASAISQSAKFEATISEAYAKGGAETLAQVDLLRQKAIGLGDATKFSAQEVAEAEVVFAQAGFKNVQILEAVTGATTLAAAGNLNLARSAEIGASTMAQFGKSAKDFPNIADVLVNAANNAKMNVENMASALKYIGPTAHALKIPLEEAAAYTMMMANAGMEGSIGARAFGTSLAGRLTGGIKTASDEMQRIGLRVFDTRGRFLGLEEMIRRTNRAMSGMTDEEKLRSQVTIFGAESIQEINQLLTGQVEIMKDGAKVTLSGADALRYFTDMNMRASDGIGVAAKTTKIMLDNLQGDIVIFKSLVETTMISVGKQFEKVLRPIFQDLTRALSGIKAFINTPLGGTLIRIAGGLGLVLTGLIAVNFIIGILVPALWSMVTAGAALMIEFAPVIAGFAALAGAIYMANQAMDEFANLEAGLSGDRGGLVGMLQTLGGYFSVMGQAWNTWNGKDFAIKSSTLEAMDKIGEKENALNMATWLIRLKEILLGVGEGLEGIWGSMRNIKNEFVALLTLIGGPEFAKAFGDASTWHNFGKALTINLQIVFYLLEGIMKLMIGIAFLAKEGWTAFKNDADFATTFTKNLLKDDWSDINSYWKGGDLMDKIKKSIPGSQDPKALTLSPAGNQDPYFIKDVLARNAAARNQTPAATVIDKSTSKLDSLHIDVKIGDEKIHELMLNRAKLDMARD